MEEKLVSRNQTPRLYTGHLALKHLVVSKAGWQHIPYMTNSDGWKGKQLLPLSPGAESCLLCHRAALLQDLTNDVSDEGASYTGSAVKQGEISSYLSKLLQLPFQDRWKKITWYRKRK